MLTRANPRRGCRVARDPRSFLHELLEAPGIPGYEQRVQEVIRTYAGGFCDRMDTDVHGNLTLSSNSGAEPRVMLAGHCDQLGLIVSHVDDDGFVFVQTVGGWDPQQLVGQRVTVWSEAGPVAGVVARKAIHLLDEQERKQVVEVKNLWIDIGASTKEGAEEALDIGDPVTVELGVRELRNERLNAPGMDNRSGVWVVVEAFRRAVEKGVGCALSAVSTVQEEIGLRGARTSAFGLDPHVAIAVDVTHATDCPGIDKRERGAVSLGGGPVLARGPNVNPTVYARLRETAARHDIPVQIIALGRAAPNDANPLQVSRAGVATGLVQIPNRYMHSPVETVSWTDLEASAELLAHFVCTVTPDDTFVPA